MTGHEDPVHEELAGLRQEVRQLRNALDLHTAPLDVLLKRRGFSIYKREPAGDLLLPSPEFRDRFYGMLRKYSFRLFLRDVIKHQHGFTLEQVARYASVPVTGGYIDALLQAGLLERRAGSFALAGGPRKSFGATLEWFIAEVLRREFGMEAAWGVKFRKQAAGGDYDVIAKFDGSLLYVEVKSSPPKQVMESEIKAFLDRIADLAPAAAVFFMDTELRMKDKIVPLFESGLARRRGPPAPVERMERELFHIRGRIFIMNAKESVAGNLERIFAWHYRAHAAVPGPS